MKKSVRIASASWMLNFKKKMAIYDIPSILNMAFPFASTPSNIKVRLSHSTAKDFMPQQVITLYLWLIKLILRTLLFHLGFSNSNGFAH
jgi:hypothetical protein